MPSGIVLPSAPFVPVNCGSLTLSNVSRGEAIPFVMSYSPSHLPLPKPVDVSSALADTTRSPASVAP